jgi:hypothetical protein
MRATRVLWTTLVALTVILGAADISGPAMASVVNPLIGSFGTGGPGVGAFSNLQGEAVDQTTGDVYVYDAGEGGRVYKFSSMGAPVKFSGLESTSHPYVIEGVGGSGSGQEEIAVDSSAASPDYGDIYVANDSAVLIYGSNGVKLGELTGGEACGVAVGPTGAVYVGFQYPPAVKRYVPSVNPVTDTDFTSELSADGICNVAVDSGNNVYADVAPAGPVIKYTAAEFDANKAGEDFGFGGTLAVDPANNDVYLNEEGQFARYSPLGVSLSSSPRGELSNSFGVAVNDVGGAAGDVYVSNDAKGVVNVYGPAVIYSDVVTGEASNRTQRSAMVAGTVNTDEAGSATCAFEYGTDTTYNLGAVPCSTTVPSGNSPVEVSASLEGLQILTTYYYRLRSTNENGTSYGSGQSFATLSLPPTVGEHAPSASNIAHTSVELSGTINPEKVPTFYHFIYGTTNSYGSTGPELEGGFGDSDETVGQFIGGLEPSTTYHYALVATNEAGTITGPDETFTTSALTPPALTTGAVENITQTSATLTGTVGTEGEITTIYGFDLGTNTDYTQAFVVGHTEAGEPSPGTIAQTVGGLEPGTTYHYRLFATNTDGTTHSSDGTFTTVGPPNPSTVLDILTVPTSTPLLSYVPNVAFPAETKTVTVKKKVKAKKKAAKHKAKKHKAKKSSGTR